MSHEEDFIEELSGALNELADRNKREQTLIEHMRLALEVADNNTISEFRRVVSDHEQRRAQLFAEMTAFADRALSTRQISHSAPQAAIQQPGGTMLPHQQNGAAAASDDDPDPLRIYTRAPE